MLHCRRTEIKSKIQTKHNINNNYKITQIVHVHRYKIYGYKLFNKSILRISSDLLYNFNRCQLNFEYDLKPIKKDKITEKLFQIKFIQKKMHP